MDSATPAGPRLREIVDRLLASTLITASDRRFLEQVRTDLADLDQAASGSSPIPIRHEPRTVPDPFIVSLRMPEGKR